MEFFSGRILGCRGVLLMRDGQNFRFKLMITFECVVVKLLGSSNFFGFMFFSEAVGINIFLSSLV